MRKYVIGGLLGAIIVALGISKVVRGPTSAHAASPSPIYIDALRDAAKLEGLEVEMHQLVTFEPDPPVPQTFGQTLAAWAKDIVDHEKGQALVFATARYMVDLGRLDDSSVEVRDRTVFVRLPPVAVTIDLKPEETVVLRSNLSPGGETALLASAKLKLESEARSNARLTARAQVSAERAIRDLILRLGYFAVNFGPPHVPSAS
jgi:hypothetical protein